MEFWTVQHKKVASILIEKGIYYPDFKFAKKYSDMQKMYPELLTEYNVRNRKDLKGLIFGFGKLKNKTINSYSEFCYFFKNNPLLSQAFNFWNKDHLVLKINIEEEFDAVPIELNDFIKLTFHKTNDVKGILRLENAERQTNPYYSFATDIKGIKDRFSKGEIIENFCVQIHYSHLKLTDIVEAQPMFDYKKYGVPYPKDVTLKKIQEEILRK